MSGPAGAGQDDAASERPGGVDPALLDLVVCPDCHGALAVQDAPGPDGLALACRSCGLVYPVRDGIPVLLVDEARRPG